VTSRPRVVTAALWCFTVALIIGSAMLAVPWHEPDLGVITLLVIGSLVLAAAQGLNWARWTLTVLTIVALGATWPVLSFQMSYRMDMAAATAVQIVLELVGCYLLLRPASTAWYRRARPAG